MAYSFYVVRPIGRRFGGDFRRELLIRKDLQCPPYVSVSFVVLFQGDFLRAPVLNFTHPQVVFRPAVE